MGKGIGFNAASQKSGLFTEATKMRKLCLIAIALLLLLSFNCAIAESNGDANAADVPDAIAAFVNGSRWSGWQITGWVNPSHIQNGNACGFAVVKNGNKNVLLAFGRENNHWTYQWYNSAALPQVEAPIQLCDDALVNDGLRGARFSSYYIINGETMEDRCMWLQKENGSWHLAAMYRYNPLMFYDTSRDNALRLYNSGWVASPETNVWIYGSYQTNMRYFNLNEFPKTVKEAREKLSNPPKIPDGTLQAKKIQFSSGKKYKVYQGPGFEYGQADNGKAFVSTNDWIQVFGMENDWIMIQYDITSKHMRIGWISVEALPKKAVVAELAFFPSIVSISRRADITDDPIYSRTAVASLKEDSQVNLLAVMGEWAYVESIDTQPIRGFVSLDAIVTR